MFETDYKAVVDVFHSHKIDQFEFERLIKDYKTLFFLNVNLSLHLIIRKSNRVTHIVTKAACYNVSPFYWLEAPPFIVEALVIDCSSC